MERLNGGRDALHVHRPAEICRALLAALDAAEGRRRRRKRDQTPDAFGLRVKRELLERVIADDPPADAFEQWLLEYPARCGKAELAGPARAMARAVYDEWRLAHSSNEFRNWLNQGAPSADAFTTPAEPRPMRPAPAPAEPASHEAVCPEPVEESSACEARHTL